ncbi:hypothetical protein [Armatimonas sp.]|uniref:CBU_0592 family membrane protein n=1 Tax=Armatimonas sp. TaxID=1872638 RepID=UPI00286D2453|nr:hypothetical protein [Armatimonas sp.]
MEPFVQLIGAILVLVAFVLAQRRRLAQDSFTYLLLNTLGSVVLGVAALRGQQWGFLVLEVVWGLVSLQGLITCLRTRQKKEMP